MKTQIDTLNSIKNRGTLLFYGIGNVGRGDDGLGVRLIEALETLQGLSKISFLANYHLNIEDALEISSYETVIFVDASIDEKTLIPFEIKAISAAADISFSTHAMKIESILALSDQLYAKTPKAYLLTMRGYHWEIIDELSQQALAHLKATTRCLSHWLLY